MSVMLKRKAAEYGASGLELSPADLEKINGYALREFTVEELFAFKATACDNALDRDFEAFSTQTLRNLAKLIVGKPVLDGHDWSGGQCARIYDARVVTEPGDNKQAADGGDYARLEVYCYLPRTGEAQERIGLIESGVQKEMSIACSTRKNTCSVCGNGYYSGQCEHLRGRKYEDATCWVLLEDAADALELSFVGVPAQPEAGVAKGAEALDLRERLDAICEMVKGLCGQVKARDMAVENGQPESVASGLEGALLEQKAGKTGSQKGEEGPTQGQKHGDDAEIGALIRSANALADRMLAGGEN